MNILITGATGGMGNYALEFLKKIVPQDEIFALVIFMLLLTLANFIP